MKWHGFVVLTFCSNCQALLAHVSCMGVVMSDDVIELLTCWHRSGFLSAMTDLHVLVSSCLVQVSEKDGTLSMHDQLRDLAYCVVREEGSSIAQRTRLLGRDAEDALSEGVRDYIVPSCFCA